jgi:SHS2 domain-containing protein
VAGAERGSFRFVDEVTSDASFVAEAPTLSALFTAASDALLALTVERPDEVRALVRHELELDDERLDWLLLRFLNELIYLRDAEGLLLRVETLELEDSTPELRLRATLVGEPLDLTRHTAASEVKAATAYGLRVERGAGGWTASATLDV